LRAARVYLIRHGQAGLRAHYDTLSDLGREQAARLRAWFAAEGIALDRAISGPLERQVETARGAVGDPEIEPRLAEFDLDAVYRGIAPLLARDDDDFARGYESLQAAVASPDAREHRQWTGTDVGVFRAWYESRYEFDGESWADFKARALAARDLVAGIAPGSNVAIFTSATPVGLWLAGILGADDERAMKLAGSCYNASITTLRIDGDELRLLGYNSIGHLEPALRTFR
jgi:broad specificity phosphatase PhoE